MNPPAIAWRRTLVASGLLTALVAALFWETLDGMVDIWVRSETYSHSFLILPISLWLAWRRREELAAMAPRAAPEVLLVSLLAATTWLLANVLGVLVGEQLALVAFWLTGLWALLGHRVARVLMFPLLFLFLMVPMGEGLVPPMMDFTADFTVRLLELTGIPVYREGLFFVIPSGTWSVVEACSGVRYLIASVTLGLLYAYLTYRSLWRRVLFVLLAVLVPILANGLRAYMIVMIGHLSDMKLAVGVDHLIYGWVFFGLVMLLLFWLGGRWAEDTSGVPANQARAAESQARGGLARVAATLVGVALVAIAARVVLASGEGPVAPLAGLTLPDQVHGWVRSDVPGLHWPARIEHADRVIHLGYLKNGVEVDVKLGLYRRQRQGAEVISSSNMVLDEEARGWRVAGHRPLSLPLDGGLDVEAYKLAQAQQFLLGDASQRLLVAGWYRLGTYSTTNEYSGKWYQAMALLTEGRRDGVYVMLATRDDGQAPARLAAFTQQVLPTILMALDTEMAR